MAYTASQPVKEIPGFARVGEAVRKGLLKVTTPLFGTPENPTTFGKVMNFIDEASAYGTMAGPAAAVGRMRFAAHPVRGSRIVDARFLGSETLPLSNRLAASGTVAAPKSMFSNSPGGIAMAAKDGNVILPREADVRLYRSERIRLPNGRSVPLSDIPAIASSIDASSASLAQKQAAVAKLNDAATPYWMYWMYEKDIADANATLARFRSGGRWYDNASVRNYDVLARGDAATVVGNPIGTRYQVGQTVFSPNHVSAMSRDRFMKDPRLFDVYNDGYLPYQSMTFTAAPKLVKGKPVTPVMRVTDHHEVVRGPTGSIVYGGSDLKLPHAEYRTYDRTYHVGRDIPYFNFKANEPGGVDLMYRLDNGTPVVRNQGSYSASVAVQQASKGGDSPHRNFRNFLATDKVPDSIFGYPVVQDESGYTKSDLEFFRKNPKAAGFYDLGRDEMAEDVPQQAAGAEGTTPQLSEQQLRAIAGGPRRQWATAFEDKLDVRPIRQQDGSVTWMVYPKKRKDGAIDAAGYRGFKGKTDGKWHMHTNTSPMSLGQWLENADTFDADADDTVDAILRDFGLDGTRVPRATKDTLWDMAFISGLDAEKGIRGVFRNSGNLHTTFGRLVDSGRLTREEAFDLALLSELDTYHKGNRGRVMARVGRLADAISEIGDSDRTPYRSAGEAFGAAVVAGTRGTAEEREYEGFKTRMKNVKAAVEDIASGGDGRVLWRKRGTREHNENAGRSV